MRKYANPDNSKRIEDAVKASTSIRQVLLKLGLSPKGGGSYRLIHKWIKELDIDTSHFTGKGWNKGCHSPKRSIQDYLTNRVPITSHKLKLRLFKENIKEKRCEICGSTEWLGSPLPLELDHIDGNHFNNVLTNLRILCPNCYSQQENNCGKNKGKAKYL